MRITPDLEGQRFGRLTVVCKDETRPTDHGRYWKCICDCGNVSHASTHALISGNKTSCGCLLREITTQRNTTHNQSKTRLYGVFCTMVARCENPNVERYDRYGGRGINICKEWREDFMAFRNWALANGYQKGLSIDRIDCNGDYCPENCRWVDAVTQQNNRSTNHLVEYGGKKYTIADLARTFNLGYSFVYGRVAKGTSIEDIVDGKIPVRRSRSALYEIDGRVHTLMEWINISPVCQSTVRTRLSRGWSMERALFYVPNEGKNNAKKTRMRFDRPEVRSVDGHRQGTEPGEEGRMELCMRLRKQDNSADL